MADDEDMSGRGEYLEASEVTSNNHIYLATQGDLIRYVGKGGPLRPWDKHTAEAENALTSSEVLLSSQFSTEKDAEIAESLLIVALSMASRTTPDLANQQGMETTKHLAPVLVQRKPGILKYEDATNAVIVSITPGGLDGRSAPSGQTPSKELAERCSKWWNFGAAIQRGDSPSTLLAVSNKTKPTVVIGVWQLKRDWATKHEDGWEANIVTKTANVNGWQGMEFDWQGRHPQRLQWSNDLSQLAARPKQAA